MADANLFDLGVGVPGAGEGIIDLIEFFTLGLLAQSFLFEINFFLLHLFQLGLMLRSKF